MWDTTKGSGRYYYRSERVDGKPRRVYVGTGMIADLVAQLDAKEQEQKAAQDAEHRRQKAQDHAVLRDIDAEYRQLKAQVADQAAEKGLYQHGRGEWRRMTKRQQDEYHLVKANEPRDLTQARAVSGLLVADQMVDTYCVGQPEAATVIRNEMRILRADLGFDNAPAAEYELIAHVIECWVWMKLRTLKMLQVTSGEHTFKAGQYWEQRVTEAQRRYLRAMNQLSKWRRLPPTVQVNFAHQQIVQNIPDNGRK